MILEIATLDIRKSALEDFEAAFEDAKQVIAQSPGFVGLELYHCVETATKYQILIEWESIEDHTVTFRKSDLFDEWREIISPFFQNAPHVEHFVWKSSSDDN